MKNIFPRIISVIYWYSVSTKGLHVRSIHFYIFLFESRALCAHAYVVMNEKDRQRGKCFVFGSVHLNGNLAPIVRVVLVCCGTSGRNKKY